MDLVKEINDFYYHMALYELQVMNGNDYYNGLSYNSLLYINVMEQMEECTVSKMADVLIVDPTVEKTVCAEDFCSKGKNSPEDQ